MPSHSSPIFKTSFLIVVLYFFKEAKPTSSNTRSTFKSKIANAAFKTAIEDAVVSGPIPSPSNTKNLRLIHFQQYYI